MSDQTVPCCIDCAAGRPCMSGCVPGERTIPKFALTPQQAPCYPGGGRFGNIPTDDGHRVPPRLVAVPTPAQVPPPAYVASPPPPASPAPLSPPPYVASPSPASPASPAAMGPIASQTAGQGVSPSGQVWSVPVAKDAFGGRPAPWSEPPMPTWSAAEWEWWQPSGQQPRPRTSTTSTTRPGTTTTTPKPTQVNLAPEIIGAASNALGQGTQLILGVIQSSNTRAVAEMENNTRIRLAEIASETARTQNAEQRAQLETQMAALRQLIEATQQRQTELRTDTSPIVTQQPTPTSPTNTAMWVVIGVLGAAVVGGGVYLATRERPSRRNPPRRNYYGTPWE